MNIDWGAIVEKVPEVAIVLIFVWFTLKMLAGIRSFLTSRDKAFLSQLEVLGNSHNEEIKEMTKKQAEQTNVLTKLIAQVPENTNLLERLSEKYKQ